jgi:hypothetical protein
LQCASPDAIARLRATELKHDAEELWKEYFRNQKHGSLKDYLVNCLGNNKDTENDGSLVQVSFLTMNNFKMCIVVNACRLLFQRNCLSFLLPTKQGQLYKTVNYFLTTIL